MKHDYETFDEYATRVAHEVTLYDLWDALIDRVPWPTEGERDQWRALVQKHREINLYGYLATKITEKRQ